MPRIGLGLFRVPPETVASCVATALGIGYRLFDTAASYGNEEALGRALGDSRAARSSLFITSKLWNSDHGYSNALRALQKSLDKLRLDYLDLYLIHWPLPMHDRYIETWSALERIHAEGLVRTIGVSNFEIRHLERLLAGASIVPAVNQVELHPGFPRNKLREFCMQHGIQVQAWSPLGQGRGLLDDSTVRRVARRNRRTPAQVVLRWHLTRRTAVIPKSVTPSRIRENILVDDFELSDGDIEALDGVGSGEDRLGPDPETFDVT